MCRHEIQYTRYRDAGFSLLELVVAVSIMLILGVVGFVSYQNYTDNARQANVESEASQVLTAAVAADNTPGNNVNNAVRDYNASSSEITANITEATADGITVTATDLNGTVGVARISGNYSAVDTTNFSEPGVTFSWAGEPYNSASIKHKNGQEAARNYFPNPEFTQSGAPTPDSINRYSKDGATGSLSFDQGAFTVDTTMEERIGRFGTRVEIIGYNGADNVIRIKYLPEVFDDANHRIVVYVDEYNEHYNFLGATTHYSSGVVEGEEVFVELESKPDAVRMNLHFWVQPRVTNAGIASQSKVTFWEPYVGPADGEFFTGDSV